MRRLVIVALATVLVIGIGTVAASTPRGERGRSSADATGPRAPVVFVLGDSYTMGIYRIKPEETYAADTARTLGWQIIFSGHSGIGFVETGRVGKTFTTFFDEQLAWRPEPDMVVVSGGHNDWKYPPEEVGEAALALLNSIKSRWPKAHLLLMGPLWGGDPPAKPLAIRDALKQSADALTVPFVDPLQEKWITGNVRRGQGNAAEYIRPDGIHPNPEGNAYIADRFVASLRSLGLDHPQRGRRPTSKRAPAGG